MSTCKSAIAASFIWQSPPHHTAEPPFLPVSAPRSNDRQPSSLWISPAAAASPACIYPCSKGIGCGRDIRGQVWLDTSGNRIQAHGGSVFYMDGIYYWYGENKEKTDGRSDIWHWGVRCYTSRDLYNWEDAADSALREAFITQRNADHYGSIDPFAYESVLAAYSEEGRGIFPPIRHSPSAVM